MATTYKGEEYLQCVISGTSSDSSHFSSSLDPEEKDTLIDVINKLLEDKSTLVAGSAVQAFEEVCPERFDLIHK